MKPHIDQAMRDTLVDFAKTLGIVAGIPAILAPVIVGLMVLWIPAGCLAVAVIVIGGVTLSIRDSAARTRRPLK